MRSDLFGCSSAIDMGRRPKESLVLGEIMQATSNVLSGWAKSLGSCSRVPRDPSENCSSVSRFAPSFIKRDKVFV